MKLKSALLIAATACIATTAFAGQRTLLPSQYEVGLLTGYGIWPALKLKTGNFGTECQNRSRVFHAPAFILESGVIDTSTESGANAFANILNMYQNTLLAAKQSGKSITVKYHHDNNLGECVINELYIK